MPVRELRGHDEKKIEAAIQTQTAAVAKSADVQKMSTGEAMLDQLATNVATSIGSKVRRLGVPIPSDDFMSEDADTLNRIRAATSQAMQPKYEGIDKSFGYETKVDESGKTVDAEDYVMPKWLRPGSLSRNAVGVASNLPEMAIAGATGGTLGMAGYFGLGSANEAYTQAKDAGLSEQEAIAHARNQGLIEAGVTLGFSAAGKLAGSSTLGGAETIIANAAKAGKLGSPATKQALKKTITDGAKSLSAEQAEELTIGVLTAAQDVYSGVDPNATQPDRLLEMAQDTFLQTLGTMGAVGGASKAAQLAMRQNVTQEEFTPDAEADTDSDATGEADTAEEPADVTTVLGGLFADGPKTQGEVEQALEDAGFDLNDPDTLADVNSAIDALLADGYEVDEASGTIRKADSLSQGTQQPDFMRDALIQSGMDPDVINEMDDDGVAAMYAVHEAHQQSSMGIGTEPVPETESVTQTEADASQKGGDRNEVQEQLRGQEETQQAQEPVETPAENEASAAAATDAETGKVQPPKFESYEQFAKAYRDAFKQMMKYTENQVGSREWAQRMADMADAHPDWADQVENEPEPQEGSPAPVVNEVQKPTDAIGEETPQETGTGENIESTEPEADPQNQQDQTGAGAIRPDEIAGTLSGIGKGITDGLYQKVWADLESGQLAKMDKPPLFEQMVLLGRNSGVVRSLEDVRSISEGWTGDFETDKKVGVNNLNKLAAKYKDQTAAGERYPLPESVKSQADADLVNRRLGAGETVPESIYNEYQKWITDNPVPMGNKPKRLGGGKKKAIPQPEQGKAENGEPIDLSISGQSKPVPGMEGEEAAFTVHKRKPDMIPHTFTVHVSGKPKGKGWTSVTRTGMSAQEAYDGAIELFKQKRISQPAQQFEYGDSVARADDPNYVGRFEGKNKDGDYIVKKNGSRTTWPADKTVRSDAKLDDQGRVIKEQPAEIAKPLTPDDVSIDDLMATAMEGMAEVTGNTMPEPESKPEPTAKKRLGGKLQDAADAARKEADDIWEQLRAETEGLISLNPLANPKLQMLAARLVVAEVKANSLNFSAFVANGVERMGEEWMRQFAPLLETAWTSIRDKFKFEGMTEAKSIVAMLDESKEGNESFANEPEAIPAYVVSGMQKGPSDIKERKSSGRPIGIAVTHIQGGKVATSSDRVIDLVARHANAGNIVFLDSGMFGTVMRGEIGQEPDWERVFNEYDRVIERVDDAYRSNVMIVAPDYLVKTEQGVIGDPERTQDLQSKYRYRLSEYQDQGVSLIVPVQRDFTGEKSLSELAADITDFIDFNTKRVSFGIPYNAARFSDEEILEFVEKNKGTGLRLHLLGGGKARASKLWEQIKAIDPTVYLTGDSATEVRNRPSANIPEPNESEYGTPDAPNRVELGKYFGKRFADGAKYDSITDARKEAAKLLGGKIEPGTRAAKDIDEAVEQGVVRAARAIVQEDRAAGVDKGITYDRLVDLYQRQPNLAVRTSTSMAEQAYSTPAPLAWAASVMADVNADDTAFDSSAGNGMLLIASDNGYANELNPDRKMSLDNQSLQYVWNQDATKLQVGRKFDRITINPPFGTVNDENGKEVSWQVGGIRTNKIDHAITLQTLETMEDDGKAFIIIGAKGFEKREPKSDSQRGAAYLGDKRFYDALYDGYNVVDHFTIHGNMYSRQGASFPVDVIVVDGKGKSSRPKPYNITGGGIPAVIRSWEELKDAKLRTIVGAGGAGARGNDGTNAGTVEGGNEGSPAPDAAAVPAEPAGGRVGTEDGRIPQPERLGRPDGEPGTSNATDAKRPLAETANENRPEPNDRGQRNAARPDRPDSGDRVTIKPDETAETAYQVAYTPGSKNKSVDTLIPRNHQSAVAKSLEAVAERYGDIDKFVADELGYTAEEFQEAFSAEQVDALALAIARHKAGEAFIIGDQTGVGKGRAAAAMITYANRQGLVPVFITEKPTLYADMVRDLIDIGQSTEEEPFNVLMTNSLSGNDVVPLPDGRELKQSPEAAKLNLAKAVASVHAGDLLTVGGKKKAMGRGKNKTEVEEPAVKYHAVFTTYSQMQPVKQMAPERANLLKSISPKSFYILDESHNAGGGADSDPNANQSRREDGKEATITRAEIVRGLIADAAGVYFSSATYAKRSQTMDLYARTGMTVATGGDGAKLSEAIAKGGVPLQQVVSEQLVESGMYLRRERSFDGVAFEPKTVDVDLSNLDKVSAIFNAINVFDGFAQEAINDAKDEITSGGGAIRETEATGQAGIESTSFSSILHNLVDQMLLAVKADAIADETIASIKAGESPVIYVDSTLEAALKRQVDSLGAKPGDVIDFSYRDLVRRYLERSREYTIRRDVEDADSVERIRLTDEELGPEGVAAYNRCAAMIDAFSADMPASPIDWIRKRVSDAGYSIGEITGRQVILEYGSDGLVRLGKRPDDEAGAGGRTMTVAKFNDGSVDAVLINQSGSTGISMHASVKFANQKPRHMIIGQPARNIDTFMQSLGRIHRTGQVVLPRFTLMMTNAPAENRPAGVLVKKLASLNANVTASAKGAVSFDVPDIINVLGDQIVAEYLADNPDLDYALGQLVELKADGTPKKNHGIAKKASGRMALRPVAEQQLFWESIVESYNELVDELNRIGKNPLVASTLDLQAKTRESTTIFEGDTTSANVFAQPAMIEMVTANKPGKAMTTEELTDKVTKFYDGKPVTKSVIDSWLGSIRDELSKAYREYVKSQLEGLEGEARELRNTGLYVTGNRQFSMLLERLRKFAPGTSVSIWDKNGDGTMQDVTPGFVVGVKRRKGSDKGNPLAASKWSVEIAIASPDRVARTSLSRVGEMKPDGGEEGYREFLSNSDLMNEATLKDFAETDVSPTETRYVGVGNVLAAYSQLGAAGGQVTFFTDADGNVRRGVLMPRRFSIDKWQKDKPIRFERADHVLTFLDQGGRINTPDGQLELITLRDELVLRAPSSKQKGGKYTLNQKILKASEPEEFVKKGARSEMIVTNRKQQTAVVNAILEISGLQANSDKDRARDIVEGRINNTANMVVSRRLGNSVDAGRGATDTDNKIKFNNSVPSSPVRSASDDQAGVSAANLVTTLDRIFGTVTRIGRVGNSLGQYMGLSSRENVSRVVRLAERAATSIATKIHEIAHHIDRLHAIAHDNPGKKMELDHRNPAHHKMIEELKGLDYLPEGRIFEGFAEWLRTYMTEPNEQVNGVFTAGPMKKAPEFTKWFFGEYAKKNPDLIKQVSEAKKWIDKYGDQSLIQTMRTLIGNRPGDDLEFGERFKKDAIKKSMEFKTSMLDRHAWADEIDKDYRKAGGEGPGLRDTINAYEYSSTAHANRALEDGVHDIATGEAIGSSNEGFWKTVSRLLKNDQELADAEVFAYARHTVWAARNRPSYFTGMDPKEAQRLLDDIKKNDPDQYDRFEQIAIAIARTAHDLLLMRLKSGTLTESKYNESIDNYGDYYFPMRRVMDGQRAVKGNGSGYVGVTIDVPRRSRKGSGRPVMSPFEQIHMMAHDYYDIAARGRVGERMRGMIDPAFGGVEGMGWVGVRVPPKLKPTKVLVNNVLDQLVSKGIIEQDEADQLTWDQLLDHLVQWTPAWESEPGKMIHLSYDRDGNPLLYEYDANIYKLITDLSPPHMGLATNLIRRMGKNFKSMAVSANATFAMLNLVRDYIKYLGKAKNVKGAKVFSEPIKQLGRYVNYKRRSLLGRNRDKLPSDLLMYDNAGGSTFSRAGADQASRRRHIKSRLGKTVRSRIGLDSPNPIALYRAFRESLANVRDMVESVVSISDAPARLAEMNAVIRQAGYTPLTGGKFRDDATGKVRDGLPEHVMIDAMTAAANATVNFKKGGTFAKAVDVYVPFAVASINANMVFAKQVANLKNLGQNTPEGREAGRYAAYLAATAAFTMLYYAMRHDDEDYRNAEDFDLDKFWTFGWGGTTYVRIPKTQDEAILSNAIEAMMGMLMGDDDTRDLGGVVMNDAIGRIPTGGGPVKGAAELLMNYDFFKQRKIEPEHVQRYSTQYQYTNDTRKLSILLGRLTGKLGMSPMQTEHMVNAVTAGQYEKLHRLAEGIGSGTTTVANLPGARAFFVNRHQSRPISDFYDRLGELSTQIADSSKNGMEAAPETIKAKSELERIESYQKIMAALSLAQRSGGGSQYKYTPYLVGLAREALGYEPVESSPSPLKMSDAELPDDVNAAIADYTKKIVDPALVLSGMPEKVPKDEEGKVTFAEVRGRFRDKMDAKLDYIEEHIDDPAVQRQLAEVVRSKKYRESIGRTPERGELSGAEYRDDLRRHREQVARIRKLAQSVPLQKRRLGVAAAR